MNLRLEGGVAAATVTDGMILLDERRGVYHQLNRTAAVALAALLDGASPEETAGLIAHRFAIGRQQALADVSRLIRQLHEAGLIIE